MATLDDNSGISLFGYIILFVIIVWVFGAFTGGFGGFGFGNRGFANGFATGVGVEGYGLGFEDYKAICESQKANIVQTATTQYLIEQQAANTNAVVTAQANMLATKIDFYEYQHLRDTIAQKDREITELKNQAFVKDQLAPINSQLNNIQCTMLVKPNITGIGVCCPSAAVLNGIGFNGFNQGYNTFGCNSCCGTVV